jgi:hypothetical protein
LGRVHRRIIGNRSKGASRPAKDNRRIARHRRIILVDNPTRTVVLMVLLSVLVFAVAQGKLSGRFG